MERELLTREFRYNGLKLPDIGGDLTPEEVRGVYSQQCPELATAAITGRETIGATRTARAPCTNSLRK
jgi:PRTRC genetic system protein C